MYKILILQKNPFDGGLQALHWMRRSGPKGDSTWEHWEWDKIFLLQSVWKGEWGH